MSEVSDATSAPARSIARIVLRRGLLAVGMLCGVIFCLVFPFPFEGRLSGEVFDLAHAPVFGIALLCLIGFCDPSAIGLPKRFETILRMNLGRVIAITIGLMILGVFGEYLQKFAGRSPSWGDVAANSAGMLAALAWTGSRAFYGRLRYALVFAAVGILFAVSVNPVRDVWDSIQQIRSFPVLASFERYRELGSWAPYRAHLERSSEWASDGEYSAKATLTPGRYPGIAMIWFQHDWREFNSLQLDLMNPNARPLTVTIKVFDEYHTKSGYDHSDRFHRDVTIEPDATSAVTIDLAAVKSAPAKRDMNMKRMWAIEIFSANVKETRYLFVDHVRLAK